MGGGGQRHRTQHADRLTRHSRAAVAGILLAATLLALSGCTVGPDFQRPKATVAAQWLDTGDPRVGAGSTTYRDWWKAFNDPVLDGLVEQAYRDNLTLRSAGVRVLQARAQLGIAIGEIYPQTQQAFGSIQYYRTSDRAATAAAFNGSFAYWQAQIGMQASWSPTSGASSGAASNRPTPACSRRSRTMTTRW